MADYPIQLQAKKQQSPFDKESREKIYNHIAAYVKEKKIVPPLTLHELKNHSIDISNIIKAKPEYSDFITILLNNELWKNILSTIPFERRIFLIPQCLRSKETCPGHIDEFGLVCNQCGKCRISNLQSLAENLGYAVLIAEGTTVITALLESGQVEAVIGIGCLNSLEKSFPYMTSASIPGIAIPLLTDGCDKTEIDCEYAFRTLNLINAKKEYTFINIQKTKENIESWFSNDYLKVNLNIANTETEKKAITWLAKGGKRWRPLLTVCTVLSLKETNPIQEPLKKIAIAVECFHKASLIHDDIEDNDSERYGMPTLHKTEGVPIAINTGDLLIGEGYRLISTCHIDDNKKAKMLIEASMAHRTLCIGQGEELNWMKNPTILSLSSVLNIFKNKTSPAFEVAFSLGAIYADIFDETGNIIKEFCKYLGIAYQIKDDIEDFSDNTIDNDISSLRPSILLALAFEKSKELITIFTSSQLITKDIEKTVNLIKQITNQYNLLESATTLFEKYKHKALLSLKPLKYPLLKKLLYQLIFKIL